VNLRRADRACTCAAGALLAPRLRAAAGDEPTALRTARSRTLLVQLRAHGLVHEVLLDLGAEDGVVQRDVLGLLAGLVEERCLRNLPCECDRFLSDLEQSRFEPGTAPLTSSRLRSTSTEWITSPTCVRRFAPICPAIFDPLEHA